MIEIFLWSGVTLFLIQMILLGYLLIVKSQRINKEKSIQSYFERLYPSYLAYLTGENDTDPSPAKSSAIKLLVLEKLLNKALDEFEPIIIPHRLQNLAQRHLTKSYRKKLSKGNWAQRVNALYYIEDFQMEDFKENVWNHLLSLESRDEEYRQCLRVIASFRDERILRYVIKDRHLSEGFAKQLFRRMGIDLLHQFIVILKNYENIVPLPIQSGLITYCGEVQEDAFLPFVEKQLRHNDAEIRLKAMKSLADYHCLTDSKLIAYFFESDMWQERMFAAKLSGLLRLAEYKGELEKLAGDAEWWVRFAACEAFKKLPDGESLLQVISHKHHDPYARDMARQTLTVKARQEV